MGSPSRKYGTRMICPRALHPRTIQTPYVIARCFYIPVRFIPERAGCAKCPFPDLYVPLCFTPKGKVCVFKLLFPDYFVKKSSETCRTLTRLEIICFVYPFYVYDGNRPFAPILRQRLCSLMYDVY
jgi:hypothetical protein